MIKSIGGIYCISIGRYALDTPLIKVEELRECVEDHKRIQPTKELSGTDPTRDATRRNLIDRLV